MSEPIEILAEITRYLLAFMITMTVMAPVVLLVAFA